MITVSLYYRSLSESADSSPFFVLRSLHSFEDEPLEEVEEEEEDDDEEEDDAIEEAQEGTVVCLFIDLLNDYTVNLSINPLSLFQQCPFKRVRSVYHSVRISYRNVASVLVAPLCGM